MLDVFSHVFGRKSSKPSGSQQQDGFEFVGETASDRSSISSNQGFLNDPAPPYAGATSLNKPTPYGLAPSYDITQNARTTFANPLENVPFTLHPNLRVSEDIKKSWANVSQCLASIDRYKNIEQETYYSFELENTVLNEMSQAQI